jgi:hypothetical protein
MTTTAPAPVLFGPEWAEAVRHAVDSGPTDEVRAGKLPSYWEWIEDARARHTGTWLLAAPDLPGHLLLEWEQGRCTRAGIVGPDAVASTTEAVSYVLTAPLTVWRELLAGADAGRLVMYRRIRLERGDVLTFFRLIYFVVESISALGRVPARRPV